VASSVIGQGDHVGYDLQINVPDDATDNSHVICSHTDRISLPGEHDRDGEAAGSGE